MSSYDLPQRGQLEGSMARPVGPIAAVISQLQDRMGLLTEKVHTLEGILSPVLVQTPAKNQTSDKTLRGVDAGSAHATELSALRNRLENLIDSVQGIIDRLEV